MRTVQVFTNYSKTVVAYEGKFHIFSTVYEELNSGIGQYPVALIEKDNGDVEVESIHCIRFKKEEAKRLGDNGYGVVTEHDLT